VKLNLGCGDQVVPGWINVDYAIGARLFKLPGFRALNRTFRLFRADWHDDIVVHDLRRPLPWDSESVDVVYSSHTLEHLSRDEGKRLLAECYRVLRVGGIIRIVVPDLAYIVSRYTSGQLPADRFVEELGVLYFREGSWLRRALTPFIQFPHRCMYDVESLTVIASSVGFRIDQRTPFHSGIADIRDIEFQDRTKHAVIAEGVKG
jgi:SAM-dependent methyltransferase